MRTDQVVMALYEDMSNLQKLDASELTRFVNEDVWNMIGRDADEVTRIYQRMQRRAEKMNLLQVILHKAARP